MNSAALVVSDDLILRGEARTLLRELRIACTSSGIVGFKRILESEKFDAIVLDVGNSADTKGVIEQVRTGKLNRYSIVLALVDAVQAHLRRGVRARILRFADLAASAKI